jgi:hypothetical protein
MTAAVTGCPRYDSAVSFILERMVAATSSGVYSQLERIITKYMTTHEFLQFSTMCDSNDRFSGAIQNIVCPEDRQNKMTDLYVQHYRCLISCTTEGSSICRPMRRLVSNTKRISAIETCCTTKHTGVLGIRWKYVLCGISNSRQWSQQTSFRRHRWRHTIFPCP